MSDQDLQSLRRKAVTGDPQACEAHRRAVRRLLSRHPHGIEETALRIFEVLFGQHSKEHADEFFSTTVKTSSLPVIHRLVEDSVDAACMMRSLIAEATEAA